MSRKKTSAATGPTPEIVVHVGPDGAAPHTFVQPNEPTGEGVPIVAHDVVKVIAEAEAARTARDAEEIKAEPNAIRRLLKRLGVAPVKS